MPARMNFYPIETGSRPLKANTAIMRQARRKMTKLAAGHSSSVYNDPL